MDIGAYDTCRNGCRYCYANHRPAALAANLRAHDPAAPLLTGQIMETDVIRERAMPAFSVAQTRLLDDHRDT